MQETTSRILSVIVLACSLSLGGCGWLRAGGEAVESTGDGVGYAVEETGDAVGRAAAETEEELEDAVN